MSRRSGGSFGRMWLLGGLLRGISPRESIGHSEVTEDKIPRLHVRRIILYSNAIIAILITLGAWWTGWFGDHNMYEIANIRVYTFTLVRWATWPGVLYAFAMALITRSRELHNRNWENWRIIRYVTDLAMGIGDDTQKADVPQGLPAITRLGEGVPEDAIALAFADYADGGYGATLPEELMQHQ